MMTKERIAELDSRDYRRRMSIGLAWNDLEECVEEIVNLQTLADVQKDRIARLEKDRNDLLSIVVNVDDHLLSLNTLKRKIDEVRKRMDYELPTVEQVQDAMKGTNEH